MFRLWPINFGIQVKGFAVAPFCSVCEQCWDMVAERRIVQVVKESECHTVQRDAVHYLNQRYMEEVHQIYRSTIYIGLQQETMRVSDVCDNANFHSERMFQVSVNL
jgi:hypothetical protein